jgi:hypothetical protein
MGNRFLFTLLISKNPWLNFSHDSKVKYSMKTMLCKYSNNCFNYDIQTLNYLSITYKKCENN